MIKTLEMTKDEKLNLPLALCVAFLAGAPWFYGLTRFKDQLAAELLLFGIFLLSLFLVPSEKIFQTGPLFFWRPREKNPPFDRSLDRWVWGSLWLALIYIFLSALPYQSLLTFLRFSALVLFYFLVRGSVRTPSQFIFCLWVIVGLGAAYALYGLLQYHGFLPHEYWRGRGLASRYVNEGHFAAVLMISIFTGVSLLSFHRNLLGRAALSLLLLPSLWALTLTRSRTVWGASVAGFSLLIFSLWRKRSLRAQAGVLMIAAVAAAGLFWKFGFLDAIFQRVQTLWTSDFFSLFHRWHFWQGCAAAIAERPWGWGTGALLHVMPVFRVHSDRFVVDYAHNEFLQMGVDFGFPGILFLAGFCLFFFTRTFSLLAREGGDSRQNFLGAGFLGLAAALLITSQTDFPLHIYATGFLFSFYLALSAHLFASLEKGEGTLRAGRVSSAPRGGLGIKTVYFLAVLAAGLLTARQLWAQIRFAEALRLEKDFSWDKAQTEYRKAASLDPFYPEYHETLGLFLWKRSKLSMKRDQKNLYRDEAIEALERSARLQAYGSAPRHYALALLFREKRIFEKTAAHFEEAIRRDPQNARFVSEYGFFALEEGRVEKAVQLFEQYQKIPFKEGTQGDPCQILRKFYPYTQDYRDLLRIVSKEVEDHICLGYVLGENGQWEHAVTQFEMALEKSKPRYGEDYMKVGIPPIIEFYKKHRRLQEALSLYQTALRKYPNETSWQNEITALSSQLQPAAAPALTA